MGKPILIKTNPAVARLANPATAGLVLIRPLAVSSNLDLVVEGAGKRLAVECDGDRWHPKEKLEEDMARQAILERLGWRFVRIRGSQFFRHPAKAMEAVFSRLQAFDIPPVGVESSLPAPQAGLPSRGQVGEELRMRIVRRAAELRRQWVEAGEDLLPLASLKRGLSRNRA